MKPATAAGGAVLAVLAIGAIAVAAVRGASTRPTVLGDVPVTATQGSSWRIDIGSADTLWGRPRPENSRAVVERSSFALSWSALAGGSPVALGPGGIEPLPAPTPTSPAAAHYFRLVSGQAQAQRSNRALTSTGVEGGCGPGYTCHRLHVRATFQAADPRAGAPTAGPAWCMVVADRGGTIDTLLNHLECQAGYVSFSWPNARPGAATAGSAPTWTVEGDTFAREDQLLSHVAFIDVDLAATVPAGCGQDETRPDRNAREEWDEVRLLIAGELGNTKGDGSLSVDRKAAFSDMEAELTDIEGVQWSEKFVSTMVDAITAPVGGGLGTRTLKVALSAAVAQTLQGNGLEAAAAEVGGQLLGAVGERLVGEAMGSTVEALAKPGVEEQVKKLAEAHKNGRFVLLTRPAKYFLGVKLANGSPSFIGTVVRLGCGEYAATLSRSARDGSQMVITIKWTYEKNGAGKWLPVFSSPTLGFTGKK